MMQKKVAEILPIQAMKLTALLLIQAIKLPAILTIQAMKLPVRGALVKNYVVYKKWINE